MSIVSINTKPPLLDGRQSDRAMSIRRGLQRMFHSLRCSTLAELTLTNGRRADLVSLCPKGRITIVEIKSSTEDFRADTKWPDYRNFCDSFFFATLPDVPANLFPDTEGLIIADRYDAEIVRDAEEDLLSAARRRTVVQRFASCAAERLMHAEMASEEIASLTHVQGQ
ncbi:MAG: MmcB family DNA repair protein [Pseudomonadota bacterium]